MELSNNTILITGGATGIGRALAEAFHALGSQIIIAGRRQALLDATIAANPGMHSVLLDIADPASISAAAAQLGLRFPDLNGVIHNAGIMCNENIAAGNVADAEAIIATNLLGPIRLTAALMPQLLAQPRATIMTVSSGLAFVPLASTPTYNATKAAIHSYTQSLRYQLRDTSVQVLELIPPYVQTELQGAYQASDPRAMPLAAFVSEVMQILRSTPHATEICVERVKAQRFAEAGGAYENFFVSFNDAMHAAAKP